MADQGIRTAGNNIVISPAGRQVLADANTPRGINLSKIKPNIENLNKFQMGNKNKMQIYLYIYILQQPSLVPGLVLFITSTCFTSLLSCISGLVV